MYQTSFAPYDTLLVSYHESSRKNNMKVQHYHDTYEIYLQTCGERYLFLDDVCYTLRPGDLYILKPFAIHYTESRQANYSGRFLLNFKEEKMELILNANERRILMDKLDSGIYHFNREQYQSIYNLFSQLLSYRDRKGFLAEKLQYTAVLQLLVTLIDTIRELPAHTDSMKVQAVQTELIEAIHYLNTHYQETIDLDTVADRVHMSKYHFCRLFHKITGATYLEYLYNVRLTRVHRMLLETDYSLADIASRTGFSSTAHMSRVFRGIYHTSPREFRKGAACKDDEI